MTSRISLRALIEAITLLIKAFETAIFILMKSESLKVNGYYEIDIRHGDDTRETLIARYLGKSSQTNQGEFQIGINRKTSNVILIRRKIGWLERLLKSNLIKAIKLLN